MSPSALWKCTARCPSVFVIPSSAKMKSMCHEARRNSPSVADRRPTSACMRTASRIASSSATRSSSASIAPAAKSRAGVEQRGRTQQAADVVGTEGWAHPRNLSDRRLSRPTFGSQGSCRSQPGPASPHTPRAAPASPRRAPRAGRRRRPPQQPAPGRSGRASGASVGGETSSGGSRCSRSVAPAAKASTAAATFTGTPTAR